MKVCRVKGKKTMYADPNPHPKRLPMAALLLLGALTAQFAGAQNATTVHDPAALKPPPGAHVAIVEFEDMECPDCAKANPLLREAAAKYDIPWVRHDFPLPFHPWSFQAAVNARWFDTRSKKLGDDYRDAVFANQPSISNLDVLRQFTENFAKSHNIALPFAIDPQGKFAAEVKAGCWSLVLAPTRGPMARRWWT